MPATRSATRTRVCRGKCGRLLPWDTENFGIAGRKRSGEAILRARCRVCMSRALEEHRASLRAAGLPVNVISERRGPKLPAKPAGDRIRAAAEREALATGRTHLEVWTAFAARTEIASTGQIAERMIYAWRNGETKTVTAAGAVDALGGFDLLLVDAYPQALLDELLPPVTLDD